MLIKFLRSWLDIGPALIVRPRADSVPFDQRPRSFCSRVGVNDASCYSNTSAVARVDSEIHPGHSDAVAFQSREP